MSEERYNPAKRLHRFMLELQGADKKLRITEVWKDIFSMQNKDLKLVFDGAFELRNLAQETRIQFEKIENVNHNRYLTNFRSIENFIDAMIINPSATLNNISPFNPMAMRDLEFIEEKFNENPSSEKEITDEVLISIQKDLFDVREKTTSSALREEVKKVIIDQLYVLDNAICMYRISGSPNGLKDAIVKNAGLLYIESSKLTQEEQKTSEFQSLMKISDKFFSLASRINSLDKLHEMYVKYLPVITSPFS